MTLEKLITKLMAFEKVVGGSVPVYILYLEDKGIHTQVKTSIFNVGIGYHDSEESVKALFLAETETFEFLQPSDEAKPEQ